MSDNRNEEQNDTGGSNAMWGGRFAEGPSAIMREINASIPFDKALWREDIAGSRAHVAMLAKQGIVSAEDAATIDSGLQQIAEEKLDMLKKKENRLIGADLADLATSGVLTSVADFIPAPPPQRRVGDRHRLVDECLGLPPVACAR